MIVPVEAKLASPSNTGVELGIFSPATATRASPTARPAREEKRPPSVHIRDLVVESVAPISTAAIRDGFREAWLRHDPTTRIWSPEPFHQGLTIDIPTGATGRELGRRLAEAILERARVP
jgi:hypothetical protein